MGSESSKNPGAEPDNPGRRALLGAVVAAGSAVVGVLLAVPAVAFVLDPLLRGAGRRERWVRVASLDALGEEHPTQVPVVGDQTDAWTRAEDVRLGTVWLMRKGKQVQALTAECPHLGCKVGYDKGQKQFACPCHESAFSHEGERLGGPAPRSLDPLKTRVVDGHVEVRFVRFRAQVPERVELG